MGFFENAYFFCSTQRIFFCTATQVIDEVISCLQLIDKTARILGLKYNYVLSTSKPKNSNTVESWDKSSDWLEKALIAADIQFLIDKESVNNYATQHNGLNGCGPSIEMQITDATW